MADDDKNAAKKACTIQLSLNLAKVTIIYLT